MSVMKTSGLKSGARVFVVGAGISGMGAALILQQKYRVTLLEGNHRLGGHARTKEVVCEEGVVPIDTGFIVYNVENYPHLTALFKWLKVPTKETGMSFAVSMNDGAFEWSARNLQGTFAMRRNWVNPRFWWFIREILRFNKSAKASLADGTDASLGEWLKAHRFGDYFQQRYILPMGGAIWSSTLEAMMGFPAETFFRFFQNHGLLGVNDQPQWYTVDGGSREYVQRVAKAFTGTVHLGAGVQYIEPLHDMTDADAVPKWKITCANGNQYEADAVVFACHGDQVLPMLMADMPPVRRVMSAYRTQPNEVVLHRDTTKAMPKRKAAWGCWNYLTSKLLATKKHRDGLAVTYWMNLLQGLPTKEDILVTLNATEMIAPSRIENIHLFRHPQFDQKALEAQERMPEIQGYQNLYFCGAYTRYGFHEDGLLSAVKVGESLGLATPW